MRSSSPASSGRVVLHDAAQQRWLCFSDPCQIVQTGRLDEVQPALQFIERSTEEKGCCAAGFLSYDAASAFDPALQTRLTADVPLLWFGLYPAPTVVDLPDPDFGAYSLGETIPSVSRAEYSAAIARIKQYIRSGDTYQVNYTLRLRVPFEGDPWNLFLAMVRAQSPGYAAWVDMGRFAICSASPELFFRLDGERIDCKPMKGTVRRGRTPAEDRALAKWLQHSEKNRAENLMIVDMIRNDLGRVAETGTVGTSRMFEVERHPTLWQMTTSVTARCSRPISEIFSALFPCASITGAPKIRTAGIIAELESTPRGLYTGSIGFMRPGRSAQFNVAIRTAVVDRRSRQVEYGSGGGIVWDSVSDGEYEEALLKAKILKERRPQFSLLETILWTEHDSYFLIDRHLKRLSESADYFDFSFDQEELGTRLRAEAKQFGGTAQRVRVLVSRKGEIRIEAAPLVEHSTPVRLGLAPAPIDSNDVFLYHKTTHREVYDLARQARPDCDDVLLWNERRELTESCIANVVFEIDGVLSTPPVDSGLLGGTYRAQLLEQGAIREQVTTLDDLDRCSRVFLINSVRKWQEAVLAR